LQASAALIRDRYLRRTIDPTKPIGNVAIAELYLTGNIAFCVGATSKGPGKSPIPQIPIPKSAGGQFEPATDSRTQRLMDTDAEYKVLSEIADTLEMFYDLQVEGRLYLYTELQPCESCNSVLRQFEEKFPHIKIQVFWDYPYLRES